MDPDNAPRQPDPDPTGRPDAEGAVDSRRRPLRRRATLPVRGPRHPEAANRAAPTGDPGGLPAPGSISHLPEDPGSPPAPGSVPRLPGRRVLRDEVLLVLFLSLAASALYAIVDLLSAPLRGVQAPLFANVGLVYQLLNLATSLVPVALALHFLGRSGREGTNPAGNGAPEPGG